MQMSAKSASRKFSSFRRNLIHTPSISASFTQRPDKRITPKIRNVIKSLMQAYSKEHMACMKFHDFN